MLDDLLKRHHTVHLDAQTLFNLRNGTFRGVIRRTLLAIECNDDTYELRVFLGIDNVNGLVDSSAS